MNIGQLDRKITIERHLTSLDSAGEEAGTWVLFATLHARKERKSSNEAVTSEQLVATQIETYRARYKAGVVEKMRLIDNGRIFNIRAIIEIGRKQGLEIIAEHNG